jgi:hypothetical protein
MRIYFTCSGSHRAQVAFRHVSLTLNEQSSRQDGAVVTANSEGNAGKNSLKTKRPHEGPLVTSWGRVGLLLVRSK